MQKFWNWETASEGARVLRLDGVIAEEGWYDDEVTPVLFREELDAGNGSDIVVWINSVGGDCVAAAQIYNMLSEYPGEVTVKIDGIAASAASVIAMAGDTVLMSPVSTMMIHNPATIAMGDHKDMEKAAEMLGAIKESIINAYEKKTGLSRQDLSRMMEEETWMDAGKAVELHFADGITERAPVRNSILYSRHQSETAFLNRVAVAADSSAERRRGGEPIKRYYERLERIRPL